MQSSAHAQAQAQGQATTSHAFHALSPRETVLHEAVSSPSRSVASSLKAPNASAEFALVTTRAGFDALEQDWNELFDRAARGSHVFQSFNFLWHWANHYLAESPGGIPGLTVCIVTARRNGRLIMVWPLVSQRVRGIRQVFWMGEPVGQYGDVIVDDIPDRDDVLRAGWAYLTGAMSFDLVRLRRVRADANVAPLMAELEARVTSRLVAPYLDLSSAKTFADYEQRYSARSRRNRKRLARRIEETGGLNFERVHGGALARDYATAALAHKAVWLKARGLVSNAISDRRMTAFFADAAEGAVRPTDCVVAVLKTGGEFAALDVSFACKGHIAMHVIVYNMKYEKSGAGVLLLEQALRDGYDENLHTYDMLAPGDSYKLDWSDGTIDVLDWAKPVTLAGQAYARVYLEIIRTRLKAAIHAMPNMLRRAATSSYAIVAAGL